MSSVLKDPNESNYILILGYIKRNSNNKTIPNEIIKIIKTFYRYIIFNVFKGQSGYKYEWSKK